MFPGESEFAGNLENRPGFELLRRNFFALQCSPRHGAGVMNQFSSYFLFFGAVSLTLGFLGYARAKSKASLISGGIAGILLIAGGILMLLGQRAGLWTCLAVSTLLTLRFLPVFLARKKIYPAGVMALLGIIGIVVGGLLLVP